MICLELLIKFIGENTEINFLIIPIFRKGETSVTLNLKGNLFISLTRKEFSNIES